MSDVSDPDDQTTPDRGLVSSASAPQPSQVSSAWTESEAKTEAAATTQAASAPPVTTTISLSAIEARVLGSMVEKSFLTPDVYPMTTNALVGACNQKTNRDPVMSLTAVEVDASLLELRQRELVRRVHSQGSRSTKHRQTLDEALALSEQELVLVSVLLLRGPQTLGELRTRTDRHQVGFEDLDSVDSCLQGLQARPTPLVKELARKPGQKENRWTHLLADADEAPAEAAGVPAPTVASAPVPPVPARPAPAQDEALQDKVEDLENQVAELRRQLSSLATKLGEPLD